jgi:4-aminobutyrate aminotransferase-like enzyme
LPLAGVVGRAEVMDAPAAGGLGGTYGGNPVACAAALAVFEAIESEGLLQRSQIIGERVRTFVSQLQNDARLGIGEIRGLGGMVAFEVIKPGTTNTPDADTTKTLTTRAAELGLILLSCGVYANTIRVLVPLTVEDEILEEALSLLERALRDVRP